MSTTIDHALGHDGQSAPHPVAIERNETATNGEPDAPLPQEVIAGHDVEAGHPVDGVDMKNNPETMKNIPETMKNIPAAMPIAALIEAAEGIDTIAVSIRVDEKCDQAENDETECSDLSDDDEDMENVVKRQKLVKSDEHGKVFATTDQRREQNRLHARNTRERKKLLLDQSHSKISQLLQERARLCSMINERTGEHVPAFVSSNVPAAGRVVGGQMQEIDSEMKRIEANQDGEKDKITAEQLWNIRKEKNRIHARKTRLRKKLALDEAEHTLNELGEDINNLRAKYASTVGGGAAYPIAQPTFSYPPQNYSGGAQQTHTTPAMGLPYPFNAAYMTAPTMTTQTGQNNQAAANMCLPWGYQNVSGAVACGPIGMMPFHFSPGAQLLQQMYMQQQGQSQQMSMAYQQSQNGNLYSMLQPFVSLHNGGSNSSVGMQNPPS